MFKKWVPFVAPEVFYDFNNAEVTDGSDKGELNYSYGVKANVGYDVTEKFAAFVNLGYLETRGTDSGTGYKVDYNLEALTYGIGVTYEAVENVNFKLSYEYVDYLRSGISASLNPDIIKIGVAYNF
ncbi:MAG: opacity protein-like surface antigen [Lentimonas sp.]